MENYRFSIYKVAADEFNGLSEGDIVAKLRVAQERRAFQGKHGADAEGVMRAVTKWLKVVMKPEPYFFKSMDYHFSFLIRY